MHMLTCYIHRGLPCLPLAPFLFWHITYCFFRPHQNKLGLLYHFNRASAIASYKQLLINADGSGGPFFQSPHMILRLKLIFFNPF
jgi:hypothetical protein